MRVLSALVCALPASPPTRGAASSAALYLDTPAFSHAKLLAANAHALLEKNQTLNHNQYTAVIKAAADAGLVDDCKAWIKSQRDHGQTPSLEAYAAVVAALTAAARRREAETWFRRVVQPEVSTALIQQSREPTSRAQYNRVMAAYAAAGRHDQIVTLMQTMVRKGAIQPDVVSFNSLIAAHANAGEPQRARSWLARMTKWGVTPDVVSYTSAISGFAKAREPSVASSLFDEMLAAGVSPDLKTFTVLVEAHAVSGNPHEARRWLMRASEAGCSPNVVTYSCVAKGYAIAGDMDRVFEVLDEMDSAGVAPNAATFHSLLARCSRSGEADAALKLLDRMGNGARGANVKDAVRPTTLAYNLVIGCLMRLGRESEAEALKISMESAGVPPDSVTFSSLIVHGGNKPTGPSRAADYITTLRNVGLTPDVQCYNKVIASCARARLPELAEDWLRKMSDAGVSPDLISFSSVISAYAKFGRPDHAQRLLRQMLIAGIVPDVVTYNSLLEARVRAGQLYQAAALLRQMERDDETNIKPDTVSYTIVLAAFGKRGDARRAMECFLRMNEQGVTADLGCYNAILRVLANAGKMKKAREILAQMLNEVEPDQWTFGPLIDRCRAARDYKSAVAIGRQMLRHRPSISLFSVNALRRAIGVRELRNLCRECKVLEDPKVRQVLCGENADREGRGARRK